ncbi:MAG TPA: amino acid permease C-terminal domain-containing protein, partial [Flavobacterium sp.]
IFFIVSAVAVHYIFPNFYPETFSFAGENAAQNFTMVVFLLLCVVMSVVAYLKNLSLIPLLGLISCCYLLTGMAVSNWTWFGLWLLIGLVLYFLYGYKNSKLNVHSPRRDV